MTITTNEPVATESKRNVGENEAEARSSGKIRNRTRDVRRGARLPRRAETSAEPPDSVPLSATPHVATWRSHLGERVASLPERLHKCSPYADKPASIRDVVHYTAAGGWVPGDHPWWVESWGYGWGVMIGIPGVVILNVTSWVIHKFTHTIIAAGFYALLWAVSVLPPDFGWCWHSWWWFDAEVYAALVVLSLVAVLVTRKHVRGGSAVAS